VLLAVIQTCPESYTNHDCNIKYCVLAQYPTERIVVKDLPFTTASKAKSTYIKFGGIALCIDIIIKLDFKLV
jgi:hypothetical protein